MAQEERPDHPLVQDLGAVPAEGGHAPQQEEALRGEEQLSGWGGVTGPRGGSLIIGGESRGCPWSWVGGLLGERRSLFLEQGAFGGSPRSLWWVREGPGETLWS